MNSYIRIIYDKLEFIEFKQNILLLKQPQKKASIFTELTLDKFGEIRDFTNSFQDRVFRGEKSTISEYELELYKIWPPLKSYPGSSTLVAKALINGENFNLVFKDL